MLERLKLVGQYLIGLPQLPKVLFEDIFQSKSLANDPRSEWFMDVDVWLLSNSISEAPPWKVFPNVKDGYPPVRQGNNEVYMEIWTGWFKRLSPPEKLQYLSEYCAPPAWFDRFKPQTVELAR